jgi:hypothetical protein
MGTRIEVAVDECTSGPEGLRLVQRLEIDNNIAENAMHVIAIDVSLCTPFFILLSRKTAAASRRFWLARRGSDWLSMEVRTFQEGWVDL